MKDTREKDNNIQQKKEDIKISSYAWKILSLLGVIAIMVMYSETMLIPAIPDIITDLNISFGTSSWILTAYLISGAVMTPICANLSDIYGKKKILLIVVFIYLIGTITAYFVSDIVSFVIARVIQGIGISMFPIAFSIIRDCFPREKVSIGQGVITSMFATGAAIGFSIGGLIVQTYGWHFTFLTLIPPTIIFILLVWKYLDITKISEYKQLNYDTNKYNVQSLTTKVDIKGALFLSISISCFLLALTLLENNPSDSKIQIIIMLLFIISLSTLATFVIIERRTDQPLINFKLFTNKTILSANLIILIIGFTHFMIFQSIPILARNPEPLGFGLDAASTGNIQLPFAIIFAIFGPASGIIISRMGSIKPLTLGAIISSSSFLFMLFFHTQEYYVSAALAVFATGLSFTAIGAMNIIILFTPPGYIGTSTGLSVLIRILGSSIGPVIAALYMQFNPSHIAMNESYFYPSSYSFDLIFLTVTVASLCLIILALYLKKITKEYSILD
ncbi:MAG: MFS transporter [Nitrososphaeraceae archaeon]|nr:MFS transporter [Nitrososphaeraceae archaeon]